jgi:hypothetical protein
MSMKTSSRAERPLSVRSKGPFAGAARNDQDAPIPDIGDSGRLISR